VIIINAALEVWGARLLIVQDHKYFNPEIRGLIINEYFQY
jgi:hypothetical protein